MKQKIVPALAVEKSAETEIDPAEAEEQSDMAAFSSANKGAEAGAEAAMKGAVGTEASSTLRNFRHHPDMENFYRFIYENDLRFEALGIIDQMLTEKKIRRLAKAGKAQPQ